MYWAKNISACSCIEWEECCPEKDNLLHIVTAREIWSSSHWWDGAVADDDVGWICRLVAGTDTTLVVWTAEQSFSMLRGLFISWINFTMIKLYLPVVFFFLNMSDNRIWQIVSPKLEQIEIVVIREASSWELVPQISDSKYKISGKNDGITKLKLKKHLRYAGR